MKELLFVNKRKKGGLSDVFLYLLKKESEKVRIQSTEEEKEMTARK